VQVRVGHVAIDLGFADVTLGQLRQAAGDTGGHIGDLAAMRVEVLA
jgi:hypothetical protein